MSTPTEAYYDLRRHVIFSDPDDGAELIANSEARAVAAAVTALTCTHHNDLERAACPVCLVTALTAERDQLRAALALGQQNCDDAYDDLRAERDAAIARAERAEADLKLLREWQRDVIQNASAHHAERKDAIARAESAEREAFDWKKIARYEAARAERAEREVAGLKANNRFQRGHSAGYAEAKADCATELAAERARLDWLEENAKDIMKYNCRSYIWFAHQNIRAAIDAAMKEDAK